MTKLSIIIPVYNEKVYFPQLLKKVEKVDIGDVKKEIIIIDDFSTDGTREMLKKFKKHKVLFHPHNRGKGAAIRTGLEKVTGDIIVIQDADLEYDPNDYPRLLKPILEGRTQVVYGSRFKGKTFHRRTLAIPTHYIGNRMLSAATTVLYGKWITDMETCYKMFTKNVLKHIRLRAKRFDFEPEITAKILKSGFRIIEVPISFYPRNWRQGKKISWKDGVKALYFLLKYRFTD